MKTLIQILEAIDSFWDKHAALFCIIVLIIVAGSLLVICRLIPCIA